MIMPMPGGDYERTGKESEEQRPVFYWALRSAIRIGKFIAFTMYEAFLIGTFHCLVMYLVALTSVLKVNANHHQVWVEYDKSNELFKFSFSASIVGATMLALGMKIWPGYEIGGGRLWVIFNTFSAGMHPIWMWIRVLLIAIPFLILAPTDVLEWVAVIESIFTRFRSTNFQTSDPEGIKTPIGRIYKSQSAIPTTEPYTDHEITDTTSYVVADDDQPEQEVTV